jgi:3-(3-hydroxy-phenyl)propionate hydroxylase
MSGTVDVAIVGLGPVGAILSALLGQSGIETIVLDKADDIFPLPRAVILDDEAMRIVQNLGLAEAIGPYVAAAISPTEYRGIGGKLIARYDSRPPPYPLGWHPVFAFEQPPFERLIRRSLADLPTLRVHLCAALTGLRQHQDHVELTVRNRSGAEETLRARYVVGCDGGTSLVRKLLDIDMESLNFDEPWLVVDVLVDDDKLEKLPHSIVQYCDPKRPSTHVVGAGNHRRWEFMLLPGETAEEMNQEAAIWRLLGSWLTPGDGKLWRAATYVFHALVASEWRKERILLAGDAAHMTPPFLGQGMCQGIRDAANLAWKLALVVKGQSTPELLDSYQQERSPHVHSTTETAKMLGRVICELDPVKAAERDARLLREGGDPPAVRYRHDLIPGLIEGALCSDQGMPVGMRFPQPRIVCKAGVYLLDDIVGGAFRLVLSSELAFDDVPEALRRKLAELGGAVLSLGDGQFSQPDGSRQWSIVEAEGVLGAWFRDHGLIAALVRPDHYVFSVARKTSDINAMSDLLDERLFLASRNGSVLKPDHRLLTGIP